MVAYVQPAAENPIVAHHPGWICPGILCPDRKPLLLWYGTPPDRSRPPGCIDWSLSLDAASRLRGGAIDLSGNTSLSRFSLGIPANSLYHNCFGDPHRFGG